MQQGLCDLMSVWACLRRPGLLSRYCELIGSAETGCRALQYQHPWEYAGRGVHKEDHWRGMQTLRGMNAAFKRTQTSQDISGLPL